MHGTVATDDVGTLYQALKRFSREVRNDRRLQVPPADSVTVYDSVCASQITLDALFAGGRLAEIGYRVRSCSLGQATTAILVRHASELDADTLERISGQLKEIFDGQRTQCDWPELDVFTLARAIPSRRGSAELPFYVLQLLFHRAGLAGAPLDKDVVITTHSPGGNEP
ncbi:MAG: hypothetical protein ABI114_08155 [Rhodanobacter sp.]